MGQLFAFGDQHPGARLLRAASGISLKKAAASGAVGFWGIAFCLQPFYHVLYAVPVQYRR